MSTFCAARSVVLGDALHSLPAYGAISLIVLALVAGVVLLVVWLTMRYIPHHCVGVVEKLWAFQGSVPEGQILALRGEAGYQVALLRGGIHFGWWRWQYRVHRARLVTIPQGKIGYVYARDGEPLPAGQTLGRIVACHQFQDAEAFLSPSHELEKAMPPGQRGRQRDILREGVYAINPALFVVITEDAVYALRQVQSRSEMEAIVSWQKELADVGGFRPAVVGAPRTHEEIAFAVRFSQEHPGEDHARNSDTIGIVTVHDGPSLETGEIIAPAVGNDPTMSTYHNNFQNPEAFLQAGGATWTAVSSADRRHLLHQPLVRHRGTDSQNGRPHWLCRGDCQLLWPGGTRPFRRIVPPRRTSGGRTTRCMPTSPGTG